MFKIAIKNFLAGLIDILVFLIVLNLALKLNLKIFHINPKYFNDILGLFTILYLGIIPYLNNNRTLGEILLNTNSRIEELIIPLETQENKFIKFLALFFNRIILFLMDITGISFLLGLYKIIFKKYKDKEKN